MKLYISVYGALLMAVVILLGGYSLAFAAENDSAQSIAITPKPICVSYDTNLSYGSNDVSTKGSITRLQQFLSGKGYFDATQIGSGHFGPLTRAAVIRFQTENAIPGTGFVGPLTRAALMKAQGTACDSTPTPVSEATPTLYSVNPSSAAVGDQVSVTGFGFSSSNTVLLDNSIAIAHNVPIASSIAVSCTTDSSCHPGIRQTLTFTIPTSAGPYCKPYGACPMFARLLTAGSYTIQVLSSDSASSSNALPFTITKGAQVLNSPE